MKITKGAVQLIRSYARGCSVDYDNLDKMMFYVHFVKIAERMGKGEIDEDVVRHYYQKVHNKIVLGVAKIRKFDDIKTSDNCLVNVGMVVDISKGNLTILSNVLTIANGEPIFNTPVKRIIDRGFVSNVEKNNFISFHKGVAAEVINRAEAVKLEEFTVDLLELIKKGSQ